MNIANLSRAELAAWICQALETEGVQVVLTGGSCVSIYSVEAYVSHDIDFVDVSYATSRKIKGVLEKLGFQSPQPGRRYFERKDCAYSVEFPSAPLAIGDEQIELSRTSEMQTAQGVLRLLSPTDCVKDRLSHYCHWKDAQGLEQALLVARRQPVNMAEVERWLKTEGFPEVYKEFSSRLQGNEEANSGFRR
ncbi:hypothetical protein [Microbulbifer sp.]|uniref:hypothetical protein n=1 Tax=Microbulbifer sp. TaxID=1908541 RepID=UPI003F40AEEF